jgi:predicted secreted hydrolase
MYVGGRGYIPFGNGYSYYYSLTDLKTTGTVRIFNKRLPVTGVSWMDHQWGTWSWSAVHGWTWMALQLSNGVQMSVFDFHSADGRLKAASVLTVGGKTRTLRNVTIRSTGSWKSPRSGATYPSGWVIRIPSMKARFVVTPAVKDQELIVPGDVRGSYWEGSGRLTGTWKGKPVTGKTYTELTGYAGT